MRIFIISALSGFLISNTMAFAECTALDVEQKVSEVSTELYNLEPADPNKIAKVSSRLQEISTNLATSGNMDEACAAYDRLLEEIKS